MRKHFVNTTVVMSHQVSEIRSVSRFSIAAIFMIEGTGPLDWAWEGGGAMHPARPFARAFPRSTSSVS